MAGFLRFSFYIIDKINALNEWIGKTVSWLTLALVAITFLIVVLRYAFNFSSVTMQESIGYMHALVFMLAAPYTLKADGHVRVDIFYQRCGKTARAWIDCCGVLFLLFPVAGFIIWSSWDYVVDSWKISESSNNSGGLPGIFLIKSIIIVTAFLLLLQGISLFLSNLLIVLGLDSPEEPR